VLVLTSLLRMLQSFEPADKGAASAGSFLRFFPGWPIGEAASFRSLRAQGGFLVDGRVDVTGQVQNVSLLSTVGGGCAFMGFSEYPVVWSKGKEISMFSLSPGLYKFETQGGQRYDIQ